VTLHWVAKDFSASAKCAIRHANDHLHIPLHFEVRFRLMKNSSMLLPIALLAACASNGSPRPALPPATGAPQGTEAKFVVAAATPLTDLNLVRAQIPPALSTALNAPYAVPANLSCPNLAAEVQALDAVLGADLDTPATAANPSLIERGTGAAGDAVIGAVRRTTEDVIPFRGWVRKLSGAERYARDVAAAIAAGTIRRAYLKGLGQAASCPVPAAPRI
jgi:hypothetical protein